ncbi:hypothetical protein P5E51_15775, partial [Clostridium perfringens]|nr:hypothetical protein [Clostridium perfringens]
TVASYSRTKHKTAAMVYESDFYTTRRPYRPSTSYSTVSTPRHYVVVDRDPVLPRRAEEQYSYSYQSTSERTAGSGLPQRSSYSSTVERRTGSGPGGYSYSSERSSNLGGPGGYSYSSTSSGRLPYGTTYRHYSYRV